MGCIFRCQEEAEQEVQAFSIEGLVKHLMEELEQTTKEFELLQQKMANINQAIEKLKS